MQKRLTSTHVSYNIYIKNIYKIYDKNTFTTDQKRPWVISSAFTDEQTTKCANNNIHNSQRACLKRMRGMVRAKKRDGMNLRDNIDRSVYPEMKRIQELTRTKFSEASYTLEISKRKTANRSITGSKVYGGQRESV